MSRWKNKAMVNLLRNSKEKNDHSIAAKEWQFTGEVIDHFVSDQVCQLCESENLRYHFAISNKSMGSPTLFVGSSCIKKFDITVLDESGAEVVGSKKTTFLHKKIEQKKEAAMLEILRGLWRKAGPDEKDLIEYYVHEYQRKNGFKPDNLYELFILLEKYGIEFVPFLFKVSLRSQNDLNELLYMSEPAKKLILPCLSVAQTKKFYKKKEQIKTENNRRPNIQKAPFTNSEEMIYTEPAPLQIKNQILYSSNRPEPAQKKFVLPEYVTCSICGEYTKEWVSINPNKCRKCLEKIHNKGLKD